MSDVDIGWFQGQLADRGLSQRKLAAYMGLDPGAVSLMLHGKRRMSADEVAAIARLLGVDPAEVLMHAGVMGHKGAGKPGKGNGVAKGAAGVAGAAQGLAEAVGLAVAGVSAPGGAAGSGGGQEGPGKSARDFDADFMQKWVALGYMLLKNRGP